jgi:hypothetical protein
VLAASLLAGYAVGASPPEPSASGPDLRAVSAELEPLRTWFNDNRGKPRLIVLLSPTWPGCVFGARAVRSSVVDAFPEADIAIAAVWQDVLRTDTAVTAQRAAATLLNDPRVTHFHDPRPALVVGRAFGERLLDGEEPLAWDMYLFYEPTARWRRRVPRPDDWRHQLGSDDAQADPRFRVGGALTEDLRALTQRFIQGRADARR